MLTLAGRLRVQLRRTLDSLGIDTADSQEILVNWIKNNTRVIYGSAIALKLASRLHQSPLDLATSIGLKFQTLNLGKLPDVTIRVLPSGLLQFEFTDLGIAAWLEQMIRHPWTPTPIQERQILPDLFGIQYSHARCCSLLRLGDRDQLITLESSNLIATLPLKINPNSPPIPWLNPQGKLHFTQSYEYQLLTQSVNLVDLLFCSAIPQNWQKIAEQFSQHFQQFYRYCQIWGEVKQSQPELAQARLGLVLITQVLLKILLEEKLGIMPPLDL
ncbi:Arginyl tRNA synthetase, anticodon binding [Planktothrix sp. PCC 11201]|uniref:DALR anticodon-binding domain-containing protein n=1 Tax=Planktothrix sp. PCC 11201 TaxID=1729650 RepID=UPI00092043F1|nr:DALR anticodon-binding domain-containing protein [Planktothrix sp. PCC 11201]SKB13633.1 Arginyl tRNA synthetase, anticodon binding [Planktothrix sp. PCC 11201]